MPMNPLFNISLWSGHRVSCSHLRVAGFSGLRGTFCIFEVIKILVFQLTKASHSTCWGNLKKKSKNINHCQSWTRHLRHIFELISYGLAWVSLWNLQSVSKILNNQLISFWRFFRHPFSLIMATPVGDRSDVNRCNPISYVEIRVSILGTKHGKPAKRM